MTDLVPPIFSRVSNRTGTPVAGTFITGGIVAVTAGFIPLGALAEATSIGTLFAFALVGVSVIYLRRKQPLLAERTFKAPLYPLTPLLGIAAFFPVPDGQPCAPTPGWCSVSGCSSEWACTWAMDAAVSGLER